MRLNLQALVLAAVAVSLSAAALASDVYKFIDADGTAHYVDRPSGEPSEVLLDITSKPTDHSVIQARVQARVNAKNAAREAAAAPAQLTPKEARVEREKHQQECQSYRDRLERFVQSRRLYREDEQGERVYLDEEQTRAARDRVEQQIKEHCDT